TKVETRNLLKYIPPRRIQKWSKTERTRVRSFQLGFLQSTHLTRFLLNTSVQETLFSMEWCVLQEGYGALFILLRGRYWAERQLHAGKTVTLVFHAKMELQRPPGGAGRPRDVAAWPPPLQGRSGSSLEVGSGCVAPTAIVRGRPAWLWLGS